MKAKGRLKVVSVNDGLSPRRFLEEGRAYIDRNDAVQASEKLYKAAEEAIKALARRLDLPEWQEAREKGRWTTTLLFNAVESLYKRLGDPEVRNGWNAAWFLHVEGFHETRLQISQVQFNLPPVVQLVELAQEI